MSVGVVKGVKMLPVVGLGWWSCLSGLLSILPMLH